MRVSTPRLLLYDSLMMLHPPAPLGVVMRCQHECAFRRGVIFSAAVTLCTSSLSAQTPDAALLRAWWDASPVRAVESQAPNWVKEVSGLLAVPPDKARATRADAEVRSFRGKGLENAWRATAFARIADLGVSGCAPVLAAGLRKWENGCRATGDALTRALNAVPGFAPAVAMLHELAPYPEVWAAPVDELRHIDIALLDSTLPPQRRRTLTRTATMLSVELEQGADIRHRLGGSPATWTVAESAWLRAAAFAIDGKGAEGVAQLVAAARDADGEHALWIGTAIDQVGDSAEVAEWAALPPGSLRGDWIAAFWSSRDEDAARPVGDRWVEHLRRYRHALANFRSFAAGQALYRPVLSLNSVRSECRPIVADGMNDRRRPEGPLGHTALDARGAIYIRHGEPSNRVNFPGAKGLENEAWLFNLPDGSLLTVFCQPQDRVNEMIALPLALATEWDALCQLAAFYCVLDAQMSLRNNSPWGNVAPERLARLREQGRYQFARLAFSDSYARRFAAVLPSALQLVGISGATPAILSVIEFAPKQAAALPRPASLRWQVYVTDAVGRRVVEQDVVREYTASAAGSTLVASNATPVPPGTYTVTTVVSTPDSARGAAVRRQMVTVLDQAQRPAISDITIYSPVARGLRGTIADTPVHLSPALLTGAAGRTLGVGFVARQLAGVALRVSLQVRRHGAAPGAAADITVAYVDTPTADWQWRANDVSLRELDAGGYDLELIVTAPSGETFRRVQAIVVR